jgi:hypothetical protein
MRLEAYWVYEKYSALRLHFTSKQYDVIKYNWKNRSVSNASFLKRKDRNFFYRIGSKFSKEQDCLDFLISNFVYGSPTWIGDFLTDESMRHLTRYQKLSEGFTFYFESDIIKVRDTMLEYGLSNPIKLIFDIEPDTNFPYLINLTLRNDINIETLILMNRVMKFLPKLNDKIGGSINFIWDNFYFKLQKYEKIMIPFLSNDQVKIIIKTIFFKELLTTKEKQ